MTRPSQIQDTNSTVDNAITNLLNKENNNSSSNNVNNLFPNAYCLNYVKSDAGIICLQCKKIYKNFSTLKSHRCA